MEVDGLLRPQNTPSDINFDDIASRRHGDGRLSSSLSSSEAGAVSLSTVLPYDSLADSSWTVSPLESYSATKLRSLGLDLAKQSTMIALPIHDRIPASLIVHRAYHAPRNHSSRLILCILNLCLHAENCRALLEC